MSDDTIPGDKGTGTASFPIAGAVVGTDEVRGDDEQMTEEQAAHLRQLCEKHDEPFDANLTRRQANERIDALEKM
ncbi:Protein of unknown function [Palleronia marisminoris]|uniref:DUF3072 domain-containing protein n=1 Tax=Palleronia marisminoris TaxID=315423 RepID=A0A1Y5T1T2_9RHOB|nr:DUF3072 domain-containing protein [Palleronia marisminoris]SFH14048.1 Protein of unknown function [Palleronia marisminoris]SLN53978.1 hypothetical protein PAM7066_02545 [Palleronia marisminoris]